jgi:hypothetical protein
MLEPIHVLTRQRQWLLQYQTESSPMEVVTPKMIKRAVEYV